MSPQKANPTRLEDKPLLATESRVYKLVLLFEIVTQMVLHLLMYFLNVCDRRRRSSRMLVEGTNILDHRDTEERSDATGGTLGNIEFRNVFPLTSLVEFLKDVKRKRRYVAWEFISVCQSYFRFCGERQTKGIMNWFILREFYIWTWSLVCGFLAHRWCAKSAWEMIH